jgi:hypothetical protein
MRLNTEDYKVIKRLKTVQEGIDFITLLQNQYLMLYDELLKIDKNERDMLIGKAQQLNELITIFNTIDTKLDNLAQTDAPDRF